MNEVNHSECIGGSDIAKILGKHAFEGPRNVYERLQHSDEYEEKDLSDNGHVQRGKYCEPLALGKISEVYPSLNTDSVYEKFDVGGGRDGQIRLMHPEFDFLAGSVDGISIDPLEGTAIVHEVKSPSSSGIKRIEKRGIPDRYFYQLHFYTGLTKLKFGGDVKQKIWLWDCDEWGVKEYPIEYRQDVFEESISVAKEFYRKASEGIPFKETRFASHFEPSEGNVFESERVSKWLRQYYKFHNLFKNAKELKTKIKSVILSQLDGEERIEGDTHYAKIREYPNSTHLIVREKKS